MRFIDDNDAERELPYIDRHANSREGKLLQVVGSFVDKVGGNEDYHPSAIRLVTHLPISRYPPCIDFSVDSALPVVQIAYSK